jgi:hypothetical protein
LRKRLHHHQLLECPAQRNPIIHIGSDRFPWKVTCKPLALSQLQSDPMETSGFAAQPAILGSPQVACFTSFTKCAFSYSMELWKKSHNTNWRTVEPWITSRGAYFSLLGPEFSVTQCQQWEVGKSLLLPASPIQLWLERFIKAE